MMELNCFRHTLWLTLCFIGSLSIGVLVTFVQMQKSLSHSLQDTLHHAVNSIDLTLSHGEQAATLASQWLERPCDEEVLTGIRTLVATIPDVRTVNLVKGDEIYCTSVFGGKNFKINVEQYTNGKLLLMSGNEMTPTRSLIVYRGIQHNDSNALAGIDGYYLYNILTVLSNDANLFLKVGDNILNADGHVRSDYTFHSHESIESKKFSYSIIADKSNIYNFDNFFKYEKANLAVIFIFSIFLTLLLSRYLLYLNTLEFRLKKAMQKEQLVPWVQPVVDASTGEIIGGEVLLRWNHPSLGYISPDSFIVVAEQTGMIDLITRNCISNVVHSLNQWRGELQRDVIICFNVNAGSFENDDILSLCQLFNDEVFSRKFKLVLEVTERDNVSNSSQALKNIKKLKQAGIQLSLDDFGTGNANYSYISLFSPDYLKIDKAFTSDIKDNELSTLVVESIMELSRKLGCTVIAEGIENEVQKKILSDMGVSYFQGYLFFRPVPVRDFLKLLDKYIDM